MVHVNMMYRQHMYSQRLVLAVVYFVVPTKPARQPGHQTTRAIQADSQKGALARFVQVSYRRELRLGASPSYSFVSASMCTTRVELAGNGGVSVVTCKPAKHLPGFSILLCWIATKGLCWFASTQHSICSTV